MIALSVPLFLLMIWNIVYCIIKARRDFIANNSALGVFGLLAAVGSFSVMALIVTAVLFGMSGV